MHKRTSGFSRRARWLMPAAALSMLGCPKQELAPLGPCTVSAVSERVDQTGISDVDLLFVIDNSGSMASEQLKLAAQLPRLVGVLTSGNKAYDPENPNAPVDEADRFTPVTSLHLGVVSTNMGGIDGASSPLESIRSCEGLGDDGRLQTSTEIATMGVTATRDEFVGYAAGETVLEGDPACDIGEQPKYQDYAIGEAPTQAEVASSFRCVARLGVRGCPFEQQLEAMWKALAPRGTDDLHTFLNDSRGQGDRENQGFLRPNSILAVLHVSDEEDCSITQDGKVLLENLTDDNHYGPLNLRCGLNGDPAEGFVRPVARYIDGLKSLKPDNPDRIIFGAIVGIPQDAFGKPIDEVLALDAMKFAEATRMNAAGMVVGTGLPRSSCSTFEADRVNEAYPPRRFLEVARGFENQSVVYSICEPDYAPALDLLIDRIASQLSGNCLPRQLNPSDEGLVNCEVYELLSDNDTTCTPERGHIGEPIVRTVRAGNATEMRRACKMEQVPVTGSPRQPRGDARGWYYDDFSEDLSTCKAGEKQRISFRFANDSSDLPSGAGAIFECFQPVARIDANAKGLDAVNTRCVDERGAPSQVQCDEKSNKEEGGYDLLCIEGLNTCQIECDVDPNCPPGWVCARGDNGTAEGPAYCQLPTCPQVAPISATPAEEGA